MQEYELYLTEFCRELKTLYMSAELQEMARTSNNKQQQAMITASKQMNLDFILS